MSLVILLSLLLQNKLTSDEKEQNFVKEIINYLDDRGEEEPLEENCKDSRNQIINSMCINYKNITAHAIK